MNGSSLEDTLEKVSRVITDRYGLKLVCEGGRCRTDGKTIYLPSLPENVPDGLLGAIRGWADHECAHAIYTQTRLGPKFQKEHGTEAFGILNALEDARVERLMARRYAGARLNLEDGFRFVGDRAERGQLEARGPTDQFISALYTRASGRGQQSWISPEAYSLVDRCDEELSELPSCRKTRDVAGLALRIWEKLCSELSAEDGPKEPDPSAPPDTGNGSETPSAADAQPNTPEPPVGNGRPAPPPTKAEPGTSPMELLSSAIESELTRLSSGESAQYTVYTTQHDVVEVPPVKTDFDYRHEIKQLSPYVSGVRRRLLQSLLGQRETLWLGDQARGRLDPKGLHRLVTGRSSRIFRQLVRREGKHTACTLLLDLSSSMSGASITLCRQLALTFAESLTILGFPTEIIGFSTVDRDLRSEVAQETGADTEELAKRFARFVPLYHAIFKSFEEPWKKVAGRMGSVTTRALTPLGESLLFAGRRLSRRPESRKVLFCLTDGKPVVGAWDEQVTLNHACSAVLGLTKAGIQPVGIGIMEDCVQGIFPRHAVIRTLEELPRTFLAELCRVLSK